MAEIGGRLDQPGDFVTAEHDGHLPAQQFGQRQVVGRQALMQNLAVEETKRGRVHTDGPRV